MLVGYGRHYLQRGRIQNSHVQNSLHSPFIIFFSIGKIGIFIFRCFRIIYVNRITEIQETKNPRNLLALGTEHKDWSSENCREILFCDASKFNIFEMMTDLRPMTPPPQENIIRDIIFLQ